MNELLLGDAAKHTIRKLNMKNNWFSIFLILILILLFLTQAIIFQKPETIWLSVTYYISSGIMGVGVVLTVIMVPYLVNKQISKTRIIFASGVYVIQGLRSPVVFTSKDVTTIAIVASSKLNSTTPSTHYLIVIGSKKRLAILSGMIWTTEQLQALVNDMTYFGAQQKFFEVGTTAKQIRAFDPKLLKWRELHPFGFVFGIAGGILLLAISVLVIAIAIAINSN